VILNFQEIILSGWSDGKIRLYSVETGK